MKKFKFEYWYRYGISQKDFDVIEIEALNEENAILILKKIIRTAFNIKLIK